MNTIQQKSQQKLAQLLQQSFQALRPVERPQKPLYEDTQKATVIHCPQAGLSVDISKNIISQEQLTQLFKLARTLNLEAKIATLAAGKEVNRTEHRAANHMALRDMDNHHFDGQGRDISRDIFVVLQRMEKMCWQLDAHLWRGFSNKPITDIVSIGIGGSYLGPKVFSDGLKPYWRQSLRCHYLANIDGSHLTEILKNLNADTTLFIIQSKSFATQETLKNAYACRQWFLNNGGADEQIMRHFLAVTANVTRAKSFGIAEDNIYLMWDWVGGRYSVWSAVGLPLALTVGMENFKALLGGAYAMDKHFVSAPFEENMPVILALLGVYYRNVLGVQSYAILPYDHYLRGLPDYLQQLDMESNGKSVTQEGEPVCYATGPIIWGGEGSNGQHAYHQLLHQGTDFCPCDFILPLKTHNPVADFHDILVANCLSQSQALVLGRHQQASYECLLAEGKSEAEAKRLAPHHSIPGNRPSNTLYLERITPHTLGALIALYEHKVYVQGAIWGINSFDQWGVELGKRLSVQVLAALKHGDTQELDPSTAHLVTAFRQAQGQV